MCSGDDCVRILFLLLPFSLAFSKRGNVLAKRVCSEWLRTCSWNYLGWHQVLVIMGLSLDTLQPGVQLFVCGTIKVTLLTRGKLRQLSS